MSFEMTDLTDPGPDYPRIRDAIEYLAHNAEDQPGLDDVAAAAGLSPFHFQRVFTRWAGVSPKRFVGALTLSAARAAMDAGASVLDATYEAGLSSPSRLHDLFVAHEALTPGDHRKKGEGLTLAYGVASTPFGPALLGLTARGLCHLAFIDDGAAPGESRGQGSGMGGTGDQIAALAHRFPAAELIEDQDAVTAFASRVFAPLDGKAEPLPLHLIGTNFQIQVWKALLAIPEGQTTSYGALAEGAGNKTAHRAVASAVSRNPIAWLIPCHRVLRANGALGGYYYGLPRKRTMLAFEKARQLDAVPF